MADLPSKTDETTEILQELKEQYPVLESIKFQQFMKLYLDPNSKTYGNATRCAIEAYGLDPERQYLYARKLGSRMLTKGNMIAREYADSKGWNLLKLIDISFAKVIKTNNPVWMDKFKEMTGYEVKPTETSVTNIQNNQFNIFNTEKEDRKDINEKLAQFLEKS